MILQEVKIDLNTRALNLMWEKLGAESFLNVREIGRLIRFRNSLESDGQIFDHSIANQTIRKHQQIQAQRRDDLKTVRIKCQNKGHVWRVRSQSAWDNGYDEPVICQRCGEWDM